MTDDKLLLLKSHPCSKGLQDDALEEIATAAELVRYDTGEYVHHANRAITSVCIVIHGRLQVSALDMHGNLVAQRYESAGGQFGGLAAALDAPLPMDAVAQEPTTVLRWSYQTALDLTGKHQTFRLNFSRLLAQASAKFCTRTSTERSQASLGFFMNLLQVAH